MAGQRLDDRRNDKIYGASTPIEAINIINDLFNSIKSKRIKFDIEF